MYDNETKHKFIELRSKDWSYRRIAQELGIDKSTLILWERDFAAQIDNLRQIELEALQEQLLGSQADRFKALVADFQRYSKELDSRKPQNVPQYMLFRMVCRLRDQVESRIVRPKFLPEPAPNTPEDKQ
jgi:transcriptional regulator with XRE-family HTH domain